MNALAEALEKARVVEVLDLKDELENGLTYTIISNLTVSNHAYRRINERLKISDKKEVAEYIANHLKNARYVGIVPADDGNESHLYSYNGIGVHVSLDFTNINTVIEYREQFMHELFKEVEDLQRKIIDLQLKEMRKLTRKRKSAKKKKIENKLDLQVELAELERKMFKTKSEKVKERCLTRIEEINKIIDKQENEVATIETKIRKLSGAITFMHKKQ